jgi:hypothetical protein
MHHLTATVLKTTMSRTKDLMALFSPITLPEMDRVSLLDRVDTKYFLGVNQLHTALKQLTRNYRALEINGVRLNRYQTIYFDTPDFDLYRQHHNGFGTRYKVRSRSYVDSNVAFFEIKHKTNQGRTLKSRFQIPELRTALDEKADEFVDRHTPLNADQLKPKLWNDYVRVTLVSKQHQERLTLDLNLSFGWEDRQASLPGITIAEVKQAHFSHESAFIQQMRELGLHPTPFSKYCMGVCMVYDNLKINNFKPHLRKLYRTMQEELANGTTH